MRVAKLELRDRSGGSGTAGSGFSGARPRLDGARQSVCQGVVRNDGFRFRADWESSCSIPFFLRVRILAGLRNVNAENEPKVLMRNHQKQGDDRVRPSGHAGDDLRQAVSGKGRSNRSHSAINQRLKVRTLGISTWWVGRVK